MFNHQIPHKKLGHEVRWWWRTVFNPSTRETEAGGSLGVQGQPSSRAGTKVTEKPCLRKINKQINKQNVGVVVDIYIIPAVEKLASLASSRSMTDLVSKKILKKLDGT